MSISIHFDTLRHHFSGRDMPFILHRLEWARSAKSPMSGRDREEVVPDTIVLIDPARQRHDISAPRSRP